MNLEFRLLELLAVYVTQDCIVKLFAQMIDDGVHYDDGDEFLVAKRRALGYLKITSFNSKWYGPWNVVEAVHSNFVTVSSKSGKESRIYVHACYLTLCCRRPYHFVYMHG